MPKNNIEEETNDRIATQIYLTPEIPIGSPVMNYTTCEPSGGRDAAVCVHFAIVIPALHSRPSERNQIWHTYSDRYGTDSNLNKFYPPEPSWVSGGDFRGSTIQKSGKCHELTRKSIILKKNLTPGGPSGVLGGHKLKSPGNVMDCPANQ